MNINRKLSRSTYGVLALITGLLGLVFHIYLIDKYFPGSCGTVPDLKCGGYLVAGLIWLTCLIFVIAFAVSFFQKSELKETEKSRFLSFKLGSITWAIIILFIVWIFIKYVF